MKLHSKRPTFAYVCIQFFQSKPFWQNVSSFTKKYNFSSSKYHEKPFHSQLYTLKCLSIAPGCYAISHSAKSYIFCFLDILHLQCVVKSTTLNQFISNLQNLLMTLTSYVPVNIVDFRDAVLKIQGFKVLSNRKSGSRK